MTTRTSTCLCWRECSIGVAAGTRPSATRSSFQQPIDFIEFAELAPQAGFEPATLRLTGGKNGVSRSLRPCAGRCRSVRHHSKNPAISDLRFVPPFAAVCCSLLHRKGKKRATLIASNANLRRKIPPQIMALSVDPVMGHDGRTATFSRSNPITSSLNNPVVSRFVARSSSSSSRRRRRRNVRPLDRDRCGTSIDEDADNDRWVAAALPSDTATDACAKTHRQGSVIAPCWSPSIGERLRSVAVGRCSTSGC
jgi:hypothetical protein